MRSVVSFVDGDDDGDCVDENLAKRFCNANAGDLVW